MPGCNARGGQEQQPRPLSAHAAWRGERGTPISMHGGRSLPLPCLEKMSWVIVMMVGSGVCHGVRCAHTKARSLDLLIANPFIPNQEAVRIPRTTFGFPSVPR